VPLGVSPRRPHRHQPHRRRSLPSDTERFFQGYGYAAVDPGLLAYYRVAWAVQDIAAYGEEVLLMPALGEQSRRAAVDFFADLFEPGNIVDLARASGPADPPRA
jgi:hypothetical protein